MKTIADRAEALFDSWDNRTITREEIASVLTAVQSEEREACAAICDGWEDDVAARAIRARGQR